MVLHESQTSLGLIDAKLQLRTGHMQACRIYRDDVLLKNFYIRTRPKTITEYTASQPH